MNRILLTGAGVLSLVEIHSLCLGWYAKTPISRLSKTNGKAIVKLHAPFKPDAVIWEKQFIFEPDEINKITLSTTQLFGPKSIQVLTTLYVPMVPPLIVLIKGHTLTIYIALFIYFYIGREVVKNRSNLLYKRLISIDT